MHLKRAEEEEEKEGHREILLFACAHIIWTQWLQESLRVCVPVESAPHSLTADCDCAVFPSSNEFCRPAHARLIPMTIARWYSFRFTIRCVRAFWSPLITIEFN